MRRLADFPVGCLAHRDSGYLLDSLLTNEWIARRKTWHSMHKLNENPGGAGTYRKAGFWAAVFVVIFDIDQGVLPVALADRTSLSGGWLIAAACASVAGHNWPIYKGFRGGAVGLYPLNFIILIGMGLVMFFSVGYASLATMSIGVTAAIVFVVRAWLGYSSWTYVIYGILAEALLLWALRPNIRASINRTERGVSWRAKSTGAKSEKEKEGE